MRAEDAQQRPGESAFACALVALENENSFADYVRMLKSVSKPTDDVAPSFPVACAQHIVDVIAHQLPTALLREYTEPTPEVETIAGKDLILVWSEGDAVVGYSAGMAEPEAACRDFV